MFGQVGKKISMGIAMLKGEVNFAGMLEMAEPFLTPENIIGFKDKLVEFAQSQHKEHGAPLMLSIELTGQQNDIALTILKRNPAKPGGLELYKQYFLSQLTPATIHSLVAAFKNLQQQHPQNGE